MTEQDTWDQLKLFSGITPDTRFSGFLWYFINSSFTLITSHSSFFGLYLSSKSVFSSFPYSPFLCNKSKIWDQIELFSVVKLGLGMDPVMDGCTIMLSLEIENEDFRVDLTFCLHCHSEDQGALLLTKMHMLAGQVVSRSQSVSFFFVCG